MSGAIAPRGPNRRAPHRRRSRHGVQGTASGAYLARSARATSTPQVRQVPQPAPAAAHQPAARVAPRLRCLGREPEGGSGDRSPTAASRPARQNAVRPVGAAVPRPVRASSCPLRPAAALRCDRPRSDCAAASRRVQVAVTQAELLTLVDAIDACLDAFGVRCLLPSRAGWRVAYRSAAMSSLGNALRSGLRALSAYMCASVGVRALRASTRVRPPLCVRACVASAPGHSTLAHGSRVVLRTRGRVHVHACVLGEHARRRSLMR
jgi:hypothetical protein